MIYIYIIHIYIYISKVISLSISRKKDIKGRFHRSTECPEAVAGKLLQRGDLRQRPWLQGSSDHRWARGLQLGRERRTVHQGGVQHLGEDGVPGRSLTMEKLGRNRTSHVGITIINHAFWQKNSGMIPIWFQDVAVKGNLSSKNHGINGTLNQPWHSWCSQRFSESLEHGAHQFLLKGDRWNLSFTYHLVI